MKLNRLISLFAICVCLGIVGIPTAVHPFAPAVIDAHALAPASNDAAADHMGAGSHIVCVNHDECITVSLSGQEWSSDPCAVGYDYTKMTGDILYGDGSVVSILDRYHSCTWNPWN